MSERRAGQSLVTDHTAEQILRHLTGCGREMADLTAALLEVESPSSLPETQGPVLKLLAREFEELGLEVRRVSGRRPAGHLYACPGGRARSRPYQLLLGHCDTVWPLGTLEEMPVVREGNVIRGPGAFDMKGGLVQMLFALRVLQQLHLEPSVTPVVFINSDEETGSSESTRHIRRLARRANRALILEPALGPSGKLKTTRKGVGSFEVRVIGHSAHGGLEPEAGASAILELSHVIQSLYALADPERGVTVNVGKVEGGTAANVVAAESRAVVDVRVPTCEDGHQLEEAILALEAETPGTRLEVEGEVGRPPLEKTPRNRALWRAAREAGRSLGLELEEGTSGGASDGNTTSVLTATLDGLGAVGDGAHAVHEFIYLDKMMERSALLAVLLLLPPLPVCEERRRAAG